MSVLAEQAPWWAAGPLIGALVVGMLWVANKPFGALGGYVDTVEKAVGNAPALGWRAFFALGVIGGGALYALASGRFAPTFAYGSLDSVFGGAMIAKAGWLLGAGTVMGYGARLGGGCTSGHGISGTATGSPASFVATGTFMGVAIAVTLALSLVMP